MPGGLAIVAIITCSLFTAFTGATGATIVALGALLYPALIEAGYPRRYVLGLLTSAGSLGLLFAPSLPLILYGFVAGQLGTDPPVSVRDLFLAGLLPGLLMVVLLIIHAVWVGRGLVRATLRFNASEAFAALRATAWELPLPLLVLGGIYGGFFAASEAAAITAAYVLFVCVLVKREITLRQLPKVMAESMRMVGVILLILGVALALSNWMIDQEIPTRLFEAIQQRVSSPLVFLLLLTVFLLLVGMLLDVFSAIVILVPLLVPVALGFGIHPVHLGVLMLANLQLGYFTPPVGLNLFIASYRFRAPLHELVRACVPFFLLLLGAALIIALWPALSLFLLD
jgi:tripartite ATP-independent transporter DctM subunit